MKSCQHIVLLLVCLTNGIFITSRVVAKVPGKNIEIAKDMADCLQVATSLGSIKSEYYPSITECLSLAKSADIRPKEDSTSRRGRYIGHQISGGYNLQNLLLNKKIPEAISSALNLSNSGGSINETLPGGIWNHIKKSVKILKSRYNKEKSAIKRPSGSRNSTFSKYLLGKVLNSSAAKKFLNVTTMDSEKANKVLKLLKQHSRVLTKKQQAKLDNLTESENSSKLLEVMTLVNVVKSINSSDSEMVRKTMSSISNYVDKMRPRGRCF